MSGHSKWSTIKRQKASGDLKRGQLFTKLGRAITIAVHQGGGITEPESNFRLRLAIEKAREVNMPKENIKRAVDRGGGKLETGNLRLEEVLYEAYGPFGVAILVEAVTDNKQRISSQLKHVLDQAGGRLVLPGSVSYLFVRKGLIVLVKDSLREDEILEKVLEVGGEDLEEDEESFEIYTKDTKLHEVKEKLEKAGLKILESELTYRPKSTIPISEKEKLEKILKLMESLEELDDVQKVYANFDIAKEILKA